MAPAFKKRKIVAGTTGKPVPSQLNAKITNFGRVGKAGAVRGGDSGKSGKKGFLNAGKQVQNTIKTRRSSQNETIALVEVKGDTAEEKLCLLRRVVDEKIIVKQARKRTWNEATAIAEVDVERVGKRRSFLHRDAELQQEEATFARSSDLPSSSSHQNHLATPRRNTNSKLTSSPCDSTPSEIFSDDPSSSATPPSSPILPAKSPPQGNDDLESSALDFIDLHTSLLTALSLHYAHHGAFAPVDLRLLLSGVASTWGKRRVGIIDIRRLLGVHDSRSLPSTLILTDYGAGRTCIERSVGSMASASSFRPLNTTALHDGFVAQLRQLIACSSSTSSSSSSSNTTTTTNDFLSNLPLAPINTPPSLIKANALCTKGQTRLADLRARPSATIPRVGSFISSKSKASLATRGSSLLDRLRQKQLVQSTLPAPRTPEQSARRAALLRLVDVVPVLEALTAVADTGAGLAQNTIFPPASSASTSTSNSQINDPSSHPSSSSATALPGPRLPISVEHTFAFTMPALVQALQTSLRTPLARVEAERCVRLLASEIAPAWIAVREVGRVVGVRVRKGAAMGREEVGRRVDLVLGEGE